jgi:hypothetical protein
MPKLRARLAMEELATRDDVHSRTHLAIEPSALSDECLLGVSFDHSTGRAGHRALWEGLPCDYSFRCCLPSCWGILRSLHNQELVPKPIG